MRVTWLASSVRQLARGPHNIGGHAYRRAWLRAGHVGNRGCARSEAGCETAGSASFYLCTLHPQFPMVLRMKMLRPTAEDGDTENMIPELMKLTFKEQSDST